MPEDSWTAAMAPSREARQMLVNLNRLRDTITCYQVIRARGRACPYCRCRKSGCNCYLNFDGHDGTRGTLSRRPLLNQMLVLGGGTGRTRGTITERTLAATRNLDQDLLASRLLGPVAVVLYLWEIRGNPGIFFRRREILKEKCGEKVARSV